MTVDTTAAYEERVFSQNGEDGVLRELLLRVGTPERFVVEIGAGDGSENNSTLWLERYGWSGLLIEGDAAGAERLAARFDRGRNVTVVARRIDLPALDETLREHYVPVGFDLLSIDTDGNDYWYWERMAAWRPRIVVIEYNASRGPDDDWVMPYDADHRWKGDTVFGASLAALARLGTSLGYALAGCDTSGVNAFFVARRFARTRALPALDRGGSVSSAAFGGRRSEHSADESRAARLLHNVVLRERLRRASVRRQRRSAVHRGCALARDGSDVELLGRGRAVDIGCGRGEVSAYLLARGWSVDALDYAEAAIDLTRARVRKHGLESDAFALYQTDAGAFPFAAGAYDLAIAADVVEHLNPSEVDRLFDKVASGLSRSGWFVVHTFPNVWYYRFGWPRLVAQAALRGRSAPGRSAQRLRTVDAHQRTVAEESLARAGGALSLRGRVARLPDSAVRR